MLLYAALVVLAAALLTQGRTDLRNQAKTLVTHVGVSTDSTAFAASQTRLDPTGTATNLIKTSTETDVDGDTFDATMSIDGTTEFTGSTIRTIGLLKGSAATDAICRIVRSVGIGVESGDSYTIGVRVKVEDNS